jgi:hypothetical protein
LQAQISSVLQAQISSILQAKAIQDASGGDQSAPVQLAKGEQHHGIDRQRLSPLFAN